MFHLPGYSKFHAVISHSILSVTEVASNFNPKYTVEQNNLLIGQKKHRKINSFNMAKAPFLPSSSLIAISQLSFQLPCSFPLGSYCCFIVPRFILRSKMGYSTQGKSDRNKSCKNCEKFGTCSFPNQLSCISFVQKYQFNKETYQPGIYFLRILLTKLQASKLDNDFSLAYNREKYI